MKSCPSVLRTITLAALVSLAGACGSRPSSSDLLHDAETAYNSSNYIEAQALCDTLVLRARNGEELPTDLACRVALVLVRLGEVSELENENIVSAWQSLGRAFEENPDSLTKFIRTLPQDDQATLMMLARLNVRSDTLAPAEYPDEFHASEADSIRAAQKQ